ncbi:MAG: AAC(3) family N-acetyltransferase [Clostridiales bacterium]|nr:AAC(3) family N-acetyltransferase [Clostridiales bacterium]
MVTKQDIIKSFKELGIETTDTLLVHSSLKSLGTVDGGAQTVIDALMEVVKDGTLVFPTLRQRNFQDAYKDWDVNTTPSDVGLITETFRKMEGTLRSNQETHSVAAIGKHAKYLTEAHSQGKPRYGSFGDYAFGHSSPWERMYELKAKVVFIGVSMLYNTFKHYTEQKNANDILDALPEDVREKALAEIQRFNSGGPVWFGHSAIKVQEFLTEKGYVHYGKCGEATLTMYKTEEYVPIMQKELFENPFNWLNDLGAVWVDTYKKLIK